MKLYCCILSISKWFCINLRSHNENTCVNYYEYQNECKINMITKNTLPKNLYNKFKEKTENSIFFVS